MMNSEDKNALLRQGLACLQEGNPNQAIALFVSSMSASETFDALHLLGVSYFRLKKFKRALALLELAETLRPNVGGVKVNIGNVLFEMREYSQAIHYYRQALDKGEHPKDLYFNIGNAYAKLFDAEKACESYRLSVEAGNEDTGLHVLIAQQLTHAGQFDAASGVLHVLSQHEQCREVAFSLEVTLNYEQGNFDKVRQLLDDENRWVDTPYLRDYITSQLNFLTGKFEDGGRFFDARLLHKEFSQGAITPAGARWDGQAALRGKTIFLHAEQGIGDAIQYMRFVLPLLKQGAEVILEVHNALSRVARSLSDKVSIVVRGAKLPTYDYHCPLMSLPFTMGLAGNQLSVDNAYLYASDIDRNHWKNRISAVAPSARRKIGIAWKGNARHVRDRVRSMELRAMLPLFALDAEFLVMQKEISSEEGELLAQFDNITIISDGFADFSDTIAALANIDLMITVDTSMAHIAGASGIPVWLLLSHVPDARWMLERSDSPWYPSATLFRQPRWGDWSSVISTVVKSLK